MTVQGRRPVHFFLEGILSGERAGRPFHSDFWYNVPRKEGDEHVHA